MSNPLVLCYSNNGTSMRAVDPGYVAQTGEVLFADYATEAQLAAAFPGYAPPPPPTVLIPKSLVASRVSAAGKMAAAQQALWSDPDSFMKWFAPGYPSIDVTDAKLNAFVVALGLDPAVILAPSGGSV